jgi:hypothetical protein
VVSSRADAGWTAIDVGPNSLGRLPAALRLSCNDTFFFRREFEDYYESSPGAMSSDDQHLLNVVSAVSALGQSLLMGGASSSSSPITPRMSEALQDPSGTPATAILQT